MNLKQLRSVGKLAETGFGNAVAKSVTWEDNTFEVLVKPEMSYADYEFIYTGKDDEDSFAARRIHRFILLEGGERIPYDDCKALKPSLIQALTKAINEVHLPGAAPEKKH